MPNFYEFFAGGGMARAGLGPNWDCLFANDFDYKKSRTYITNWGEGELLTEDIRKIKAKDLPGRADLVWGSFPCQDLSLAGGGAGLQGDRSGTFWPFWNIMKDLLQDGRPPKIIVLENVCGTLTSHKGKDFSAICSSLHQIDYRFGAMVIDAALFVPQSRPRLFIVAVREDILIPDPLTENDPCNPWHTRALREAFDQLEKENKRNWIWWKLATPPKRLTTFANLIEKDPLSVKWHTPQETRRLLTMMSDVNRAKVEAAKAIGRPLVGGVYRRTRLDDLGRKVQRAEIRFDDMAGCLRTPAGGSSRQFIMVVDGDSIRSRLISSRETARLMGLPDSYRLPQNYNEAYHLTGDGVVVHVVKHLTQHIFEPLIARPAIPSEAAA